MPESSTKQGASSETRFYRPRLAQVVDVFRRTSDIVLEVAEREASPAGHWPGQFVQVSAFGFGEIPISVCSSPTRGDNFQLCVRPVGHVSGALHKCSPGDWIGLRGPFGQGFPVELMKGNDVVVVAGGVGMACLRPLIQYILDNRQKYGRLMVVYGAKKPSLILFRDDVKEWSESSELEFTMTVDEPDEGWTSGKTGLVTEHMKDFTVDAEKSVGAVVGPPVMYPFAAQVLFEKGLSAERVFFSLERRFKCGMGKCGHCQLDDLYVCRDGPTFSYAQLSRRKEAEELQFPGG